MAKCQQENLRDIQEQNWKQLQYERHKVNQILSLLAPPQGSSAKQVASVQTSAKNLRTILQSRTTTNNNAAVSKPATNPVGVVDVGSVPCSRKPFPFLKKGVGLRKYKNLSRSGTCKEDLSIKKTVSFSQNVKTKTPQTFPRELKFKRVTFQEYNDMKSIAPQTFKSVVSSSETNSNAGVVLENDTEIKKLHQSEPPKVNQEGDIEELAEFEILEKVTHNCSLDSDSSLVNCLLSSKRKSDIELQEFRSHQLETSEISKPKDAVQFPVECRLPSSESPVVCSPIFDASSPSPGTSELTQNSESESFPLFLAYNKTNFGDKQPWNNTSSPDSSDNSSCDERNEEVHHKLMSSAFEEARAELLKVPEQAVNEDRLLLHERLKELEVEIENFRKENAFLAKLKADHEQARQDLEKEMQLQLDSFFGVLP